MTDTRPQFARLTQGRATQSWRSAAPAVLVVVGFVALLAYLASSVSSYSQKAMQSQRDAADAKEQIASLSKSSTKMQSDLATAKDPGRVAVILQAAAPEKTSKKKADATTAAAAPATAWAAATWGEQNDGKTWMRVDGYGLQLHSDSGQQYHAWMTPASGDPIDLGTFDINSNGSGYLFASNLPAVDQGKSLALTLDDPNAKQIGQTIAQADLPKLQPSAVAPPATPAKDAAPQARDGETTQQMHQDGNK